MSNSTTNQTDDKRPNRLINEKSPYLLQHAYNPVDWRPWGEDAFDAARKENKPIFLSVGYATCHWCHVMERESFEDPEIAALINDVFIPVKVDREERPDVDNVYMDVCQMLTGAGGWPLTIIMTPEGKPFFAATYIPPRSIYGRPGMADIIPQVKKAWIEKRSQIEEAGKTITLRLNMSENQTHSKDPGQKELDLAFNQFSAAFDRNYGGFGTKPKFPSPHNLLFLLRYWKQTKDDQALAMVENTLAAMKKGGIHDHLGGGFHRYSTDREWLAPHFEKMLYDQALLAMAYLEAYQATGKAEYENAARGIFTYVLRDMKSPDGGFYSAEDADSEGVEGKFYVWTAAEITNILGHEEAGIISKAYNIKPEGNFADEATGRKTGQNILHMTSSVGAIAQQSGISEEELETILSEAGEKLLAEREGRIRPALDDKILTDWNGLMISALAKGAQAFGDPAYAQAAERAADFILERMIASNGGLLHRFRDGEAAVQAFADDYAFMIMGLLDLYEASFNEQYLKAAMDLNDVFLKDFWDEDDGGFYFSSKDGEKLIAPTKKIYDGACPSANSTAALNLVRLSRITGDLALAEKFSAIGRAFSDQIAGAPFSHAFFLRHCSFRSGGLMILSLQERQIRPMSWKWRRSSEKTSYQLRPFFFAPGKKMTAW